MCTIERVIERSNECEETRTKYSRFALLERIHRFGKNIGLTEDYKTVYVTSAHKVEREGSDTQRLCRTIYKTSCARIE